MVEEPNKGRLVLLNSADTDVDPVVNGTIPVPPVVVTVTLLCGYGTEPVALSRDEPLLSAVVIEESSGPRLDAGLVTVPVGHGVVVPFDRGKGAEVNTALPVASDTPVERIELDPNAVAVVLTVGNGGSPEVMTGGVGACVPVPRLTLLPDGIPWPEGIPGEAVGPMIPVVFETGNGIETKGVLVGPLASLLLPVEATFDEVLVAADPVPDGLVGLEIPVAFEIGNGASEELLCSG